VRIDALSSIGAARTARAAAPAVGPAGAIPIEAWVPDPNGGIDKLVQRTGNVESSSDPVVDEAMRTGRRVLEYVHSEFGRLGIDGRGGALKLRVHAPDAYTNQPNANNAYWFNDEQRIWLGDGDGERFAPLGGGDDVVAHEFFHGVIDAEAKIRYVGQEGALHESFADVLATGIDGNWQIGEDVYTPAVAGDALRDLTRLDWTNWNSFPGGDDEVHAMSEIASHAAYLVGSAIGMSELRQVWYTALTDHLRDGAGFAGARDATIAAARVLHGARSTQVQAVIDAWTAVGITATTPKERPFSAAPTASLAAALVQPRFVPMP
jgi:bacillolysin